MNEETICEEPDYNSAGLRKGDVRDAIEFCIEKIKDKNRMTHHDSATIQSCCDSFKATMYKKLNLN